MDLTSNVTHFLIKQWLCFIGEKAYIILLDPEKIEKHLKSKSELKYYSPTVLPPIGGPRTY